MSVDCHTNENTQELRELYNAIAILLGSIIIAGAVVWSASENRSALQYLADENRSALKSHAWVNARIVRHPKEPSSTYSGKTAEQLITEGFD